MLEMGVPKFVGGDILAYMVAGFYCSYSYMIELHSCPPTMQKPIYYYCAEQREDTRAYTILRGVNRVGIAEKYFKGIQSRTPYQSNRLTFVNHLLEHS